MMHTDTIRPAEAERFHSDQPGHAARFGSDDAASEPLREPGVEEAYCRQLEQKELQQQQCSSNRPVERLPVARLARPS